MVLLLAASLATVPAPHSATAVTVQATATIRVLAAVRLKLGSDENPGAPRAPDARLRLADGTTQPARLIEFQ